jgi:hypothetical protein
VSLSTPAFSSRSQFGPRHADAPGTASPARPRPGHVIPDRPEPTCPPLLTSSPCSFRANSTRPLSHIVRSLSCRALVTPTHADASRLAAPAARVSPRLFSPGRLAVPCPAPAPARAGHKPTSNRADMPALAVFSSGPVKYSLVPGSCRHLHPRPTPAPAMTYRHFIPSALARLPLPDMACSHSGSRAGHDDLPSQRLAHTRRYRFRPCRLAQY